MVQLLGADEAVGEASVLHLYIGVSYTGISMRCGFYAPRGLS